MITYNDYLAIIKKVDEATFNELINLFPEINPSDLDEYSVSDVEDVNDLSRVLCDAYLRRFPSVYCDSAYYDTKKLELCDVNSIEDLEKIKSELSKWNIVNYNEIKEELLQEDESDTKFKILKFLRNNLTLDELKKIADDYKK